MFNDTPNNLSGNQLMGGSWKAFANSTIRLVGADIRTNKAEIVLDGTGANFYNAVTGTTDALANFATNAAGGKFTIRNGRDYTANGELTNSGTITVGYDSILTTPGGLTSMPMGILAGVGTVRADVLNAGIVAPGEDMQFTGLLTIEGDLTEQADGQFLMELCGTTRGDAYDAINISGKLHFGGLLRLSINSNFTPDFGMAFDLFNFNVGDGQFAAIDLPTLPDGLAWDTGNLYTTGTIIVVPEPSTAILFVTSIISLFACAWQRKHRLILR